MFNLNVDQFLRVFKAYVSFYSLCQAALTLIVISRMITSIFMMQAIEGASKNKINKVFEFGNYLVLSKIHLRSSRSM